MKKSTLYAPRLKGDIDLGREPSRVTGPAGDVVKAWSRIDSPGEHIPGRPTQEVWEDSDGTTPNYRIGTRRVQDERVFHYCKANGTYGITRSYWGAFDWNRYNQAGTMECWQGTLSANALAGAYQVTTLDTTAAHVEDFFAGGWVYLRPASAAIQWYRIRSSTASDSVSVTLTLWDPLKYNVTSGQVIMIVPSQYSNVKGGHGTPHDSRAGVVCVPIIGPITVDYYFWGQTWGPCIGALSQGDMSGEYFRNLVFSADGSVRGLPTPGVGSYYQLAGHSLLRYDFGQAQANGLIPYMLKLAP